MLTDILNFKIKLASLDGETSQVQIYLEDLIKTNPKLAKKALISIECLPSKIIENRDIKPIKIDKTKFYELRVKSGSDICRFFFVIQKPNVILLFGFTKKTQKTTKKDLKQGINRYCNFIDTKTMIDLDLDNLY